jgi:hypothetical protein
MRRKSVVRRNFDDGCCGEEGWEIVVRSLLAV